MLDKFKKKAESLATKAKDIASEKAEKINNEIVSKLSDNYLDSNLEEKETYCSWCFEKQKVTLKEKNNLSRNIYVCNGCGKEVVKCRVCDNKAKYSDKAEQIDNAEDKDDTVGMWSNNFCAVHEGQIAKFESLNWSLNSISEYRDIVERTEKNYKKIGTTIGFTIGGAAIIAPLAFMAAPAIGGAIGTSAMGLSGAAATNAGLATLGGGALAAGGAGMAGGVAVVTAAGSALGGRYGAVISNSYFGDIDGFDIVRVKPGIDPIVICIDGFLNEGKSDAPQKWIEGIEEKYKDNTIYYVKWESKRLEDLANTLSLSLTTGGAKSKVFGAAMSASKIAAKKLAPLGAAFQVLGLANNPWSVASVKAYQTGALLADLIARTDKEYILVGHSLGSRVIYSCLSALKTKDRVFIKDIHLLGGAVNNNCEKKDDSSNSVNWGGIEKAVSGEINNYYSKNDDILKILYKVGEGVKFDFGEPIGRNEINNEAINNIDVTDLISGHTVYKKNLSKILRV